MGIFMVLEDIEGVPSNLPDVPLNVDLPSDMAPK